MTGAIFILLCKTIWHYLIKLVIIVTRKLAISILGICTRETLAHVPQETYTGMSPKREQHICPLTRMEEINCGITIIRTLYSNEMNKLLCPLACINLGPQFLKEKKQVAKNYT